MVSPSGTLRTLDTPHTAAGPALRELVVGSEGTLGVITDVASASGRAPRKKRYQGWMAEDFEAGAEVIRKLAHADALPDVTRLSDPEETRISLAMSGMEGFKRSAFDVLPAPAQADGRLHAHHGLGGGGRGRRAAAVDLGADPAHRTARSRSARRPARRGRTAASRGRTCATS